MENRTYQCGSSARLFTKNAMELTQKASTGLTRDINMIAQGAMGNVYTSTSPQDNIWAAATLRNFMQLLRSSFFFPAG